MTPAPPRGQDGAPGGAVVGAFEALRTGAPRSVDTAARLAADGGVPDFQRAALLVQLAAVGADVRDLLSTQPTRVRSRLADASVGPAPGTGGDLPAEVLRATARGEALGRGLLHRWAAALVDGRAGPVEAAVWLSVVLGNGLRPKDTASLTEAMAASGRTYDYRAEPALHGRTLVRRYPTGGLSEKLALVLPTLLLRAARDVPVASPFLVARSLGFTGGTWDKLSSVPGFRFPLPGAESVRLLASTGVCMTVTAADLCPADRVLYRLRSLTGTVRQADLIVSSLASKQIAVPAHRCVLDVRHGPGAFLDDPAQARHVAGRVRELVAPHGVDLAPVHTPADQPNGAAVGNALEVAEAVAVLGLGPSGRWPERGLAEQRALAARMMHAMLGPVAPSRDWEGWTADRFAAGDLEESFAELLTAHAVPDGTVRDVLRDPAAALGVPEPVRVAASRAGRVRAVDAVRLGHLVNFGLAGDRPAPPHDGAGDGGGPRDLTAGVAVLVRLGDPVGPGTPLCDVYSRYWPGADARRAAEGCFDIEEGVGT